MQRMIDVSDEVRAEIGDDEADRLLGGGTAPDRYDCTSCRAPGDVTLEPTATVLFVGEETAVLAFAHARCIPSQVVEVSEEQLQGAVRNISAAMAPGAEQAVAPAPQLHVPEPYVPQPYVSELQIPDPHAPQPYVTEPHVPDAVQSPAGGEVAPAVLGVTCGLVLCQGTPRAALVVEPTGPVGRPGMSVGEDAFIELLTEHGFQPIPEVDHAPAQLRGWSVLMAMGQLHAVLQPAPGGGTNAWWQAHAPLQVTEAWRSAARQQAEVIMYAAPYGSIGRQPREDLLRHALDNAARKGLLLGSTLPLAGT